MPKEQNIPKKRACSLRCQLRPVNLLGAPKSEVLLDIKLHHSHVLAVPVWHTLLLIPRAL